MKKPLNAGFIEYINQFMSVAYATIHDELLPKVFPKFKRLLQLSLDTRVGD